MKKLSILITLLLCIASIKAQEYKIISSAFEVQGTVTVMPTGKEFVTLSVDWVGNRPSRVVIKQGSQSVQIPVKGITVNSKTRKVFTIDAAGGLGIPLNVDVPMKIEVCTTEAQFKKAQSLMKENSGYYLGVYYVKEL